MHALAVGDGLQRPHHHQSGRRRCPTELPRLCNRRWAWIDIKSRRWGASLSIEQVTMGITIIAKFTPKPVSSSLFDSCLPCPHWTV